MDKQEANEQQEEEKPQTPREIAMDTMCSTLKVAYREWNGKEGEPKTA